MTAPPGGTPGTPKRKPRLDHVDAMRPVKQAGVVSTHTLLWFAPAAAISTGGALMLLHVTREAFLFISACMLTYGYSDLARFGYRRFYHRRVVSVAVPYVCWTVIYFLVQLPGHATTLGAGFARLGFFLGTGYYQLYYLVVIMQFYVAFPALLWLVRRTRGHHVALLGVSLGVQVLLTSLMHWGVLPPHLRGYWATREVISYQFYLLAGMVVAVHLDQVHAWLCRHGWKVFGATVLAAAGAEAWYVAAHDHLAPWLGSGSDPLQPVVIPFNIGAIACVYLFGVWLVAPRRRGRVRAVAMSGSDNSYTVYLAQMLFVYALADLGWRSLERTLPWPIVAAVGVALVFGCCVLLSSVLARTPLAVPLTVRARAAWATWMPREWRRAAAAAPAASPVAPADGAAPAPAASADPSAPAADAPVRRPPGRPVGARGPLPPLDPEPPADEAWTDVTPVSSRSA